MLNLNGEVKMGIWMKNEIGKESRPIKMPPCFFVFFFNIARYLILPSKLQERMGPTQGEN